MVLIVDDDHDLRHTIVEYLQEVGIEAMCVGSAEEAFVYLSGERPHMIILDMFMPGMNGDEFLAGMNRLGLQEIPVLLMTGTNLEGEIRDSINKYAESVIIAQKPMDPDLMVETIRKVLDSRTP